MMRTLIFCIAVAMTCCRREHSLKQSVDDSVTTDRIHRVVPRLHRGMGGASGIKSLIEIAKSAHDYEMNSLALTEEEQRDLVKAYPALEKLSRNPGLMEAFWPRIRNNDSWQNPTEISWNDAKRLIMSGSVQEISQLHFQGLYIVITTRSAEHYKAPLERIDQADDLLKEIDPKRVFVNYTTQ